MDNKVLILSLGASFDNKVEDIGELNSDLEKDFENRVGRAYSMTAYSYVNDKGRLMTFKETPFVAEPLIEITEPDRVVVLGSIRSAWSSFYMKFVKKPSLVGYKELYNFEKGEEYGLVGEKLTEDGLPEQERCGIHTGGKKLDDYEKRINEIFKEAEGITVGDRGLTPEIQIILIRYGIDESQQLENYGRFKKITNSLILGPRNVVSFDTTHSFRSIPLNNLALLNYIETIENYDIQIAHVFNGCLEAIRENLVNIDGEKSNTAPILDLHGIIDLLAQTDAIKEFINTGNAVALTSDESGRDDEFLSDLKLFDWATQINDYMKIEEAIVRLARHERGPENDRAEQSSALMDRTKMILSVISSKMLGGRSLSEFGNLSAAERRLLISEWYWKQNRYGQAIATAIEAMRSMVVPYYLEKYGITGPDASQKEEDENTRRDAESRLIYLKEYLVKSGDLSVDKGGIKRAVIDVVESFYAARMVRNTFAHNLKTETREPSESNILTERDSKEIIDAFLINLRTFYERINRNKKEFKEQYTGKFSTTTRGQHQEGKIREAVILVNYTKGEDEEILKVLPEEYAGKKKYKMPSKYISGGRFKHYYTKAAAVNLDAFFNAEKTTVILYLSSLKKASYMIPMLKAYSVRDVIAIVKRDKGANYTMLFPKEFYEDEYLDNIKDIPLSDELKEELKADSYEYAEIKG